MDNKSYRMLPNIPSIFIFILNLSCMFSLYHSISLDPKISLPRSDTSEEPELHSSGVSAVTNNTHLQTYIVHVKLPYDKPNSLPFQELESLYYSFFLPTIPYSKRQTCMVHCYHHVIMGFVARLSREEVKSMAKKDGVLSATLEKFLSLHTTHSPTFMGLQQNTGLWRDANYGRGMIIGVLDSGVTLNHPSFSDAGVPTPPARWRGGCNLPCTACNNKLIGAWTTSPGDTTVNTNGHGIHVASIASGNIVNGANVFAQAISIASDIAPLARLVIYKICYQTATRATCPEKAMLAGIDLAIADGIDMLSIYVGFYPSPFYSDTIAVGAFAAIQRRIFVSCAIGNSVGFNERYQEITQLVTRDFALILLTCSSF